MKTYCCHTDATVLETKIVTFISGWNAHNNPCPFESGLSTIDMLKVSNENNVMASRHDHEITAVPGNLGYTIRQ